MLDVAHLLVSMLGDGWGLNLLLPNQHGNPLHLANGEVIVHAPRAGLNSSGLSLPTSELHFQGTLHNFSSLCS